MWGILTACFIGEIGILAGMLATGGNRKVILATYVIMAFLWTGSFILGGLNIGLLVVIMTTAGYGLPLMISDMDFGKHKDD